MTQSVSPESSSVNCRDSNRNRCYYSKNWDLITAMAAAMMKARHFLSDNLSLKLIWLTDSDCESWVKPKISLKSQEEKLL